MLGGIGCFFSSAITLLVCPYTCCLPIFANASNFQIFFPRNIANEIGYRVESQSPTPNSRPPSHFTFPQPASPKSPVNFVRYHQQRRECPPIEVEYGFPHTASRSRTRHNLNFRSLDFEVGSREDHASSYSEAPPYHQYPEEDQWEDRDRGRQREHPKADTGAVTGTTSGDAPQLPMVVLETRLKGTEGIDSPLQPVTTLHPYVRALASTRGGVQTDLRNCRSPVSHLQSVCSLKSNERTRF